MKIEPLSLKGLFSRTNELNASDDGQGTLSFLKVKRSARRGLPSCRGLMFLSQSVFVPLDSTEGWILDVHDILYEA